jgi:hypothetical protein
VVVVVEDVDALLDGACDADLLPFTLSDLKIARKKITLFETTTTTTTKLELFDCATNELDGTRERTGNDDALIDDVTSGGGEGDSTS